MDLKFPTKAFFALYAIHLITVYFSIFLINKNFTETNSGISVFATTFTIGLFWFLANLIGRLVIHLPKPSDINRCNANLWVYFFARSIVSMVAPAVAIFVLNKFTSVPQPSLWWIATSVVLLTIESLKGTIIVGLLDKD